MNHQPTMPKDPTRQNCATKRAYSKPATILIGMLLFGPMLVAQYAPQPKLVVGIVVDQMRADYIYRYWDKYGDDGFKRLVKDGFFCRNAHFNYAPTYTGPGHSSIYTGTTPMSHGIIANNWYDREADDKVYCASDEKTQSLGTNSNAGKMSPHRMLAPSLGDAIRISSNFKGKSIGISIKDRSAIFPAGHAANAAYWMDRKTGDMISSSYYMKQLPKWVKQFNGQKHPEKLASKPWSPLLAINRYTESTPDNTPYEEVLDADQGPQFPYDLAAPMKSGNYGPFVTSPYGNTLVSKFAEMTIINEDLGSDNVTDLLAISYSSTDLVGHAFGPQSIETEDTYLRLDQEIARLLKTLDERVGANEYVLFLTADHGAAQVPQYLLDNKIPAGYIQGDDLEQQLKSHLASLFGDSLVSSYSNQQVFLDREVMRAKAVDQDKVCLATKQFILNYPGIANAFSTTDLQHQAAYNHQAHLAVMGWNAQRSGDVVIQYLPGWMEWEGPGTTHGTAYNYDTHVPILFYGVGVPQGATTKKVNITQIVPTIAMICNLALPDASDQTVVEFEP